MDREKQATCPHCKREQSFTFSRSCGAWLCDTCDYHLGLCRCFCGWASDGGNGLRQLEEMGENCDADL